MNQFKELQYIKEKLTGHVAAQHKFTDQSKSLCAPSTRVEIQADILGWLSPQPGTNEHIIWITGIAGSGKSTLSATVVENLREKYTPVTAQFFISRNIPETIDPAKIIPTIALQLSEFSPAAAGIIWDVLEHGFPPTRKKQVEELQSALIRELCRSGGMVIILIDALDELENAADSAMEILLSIAPKDCDLPDNVRLITWGEADAAHSITHTSTFLSCSRGSQSARFSVWYAPFM
jgi:Cdc6-like AAA superfamily ATPase